MSSQDCYFAIAPSWKSINILLPSWTRKKEGKPGFSHFHIKGNSTEQEISNFCNYGFQSVSKHESFYWVKKIRLAMIIFRILDVRHFYIFQTGQIVKFLPTKGAGRLKGNCCIFWPAFGCCLPKTLVEICIFKVFNITNAYFNQSFGCAAPKCWSKYTTGDFTVSIQDGTIHFHVILIRAKFFLKANKFKSFQPNISSTSSLNKRWKLINKYH